MLRLRIVILLDASPRKWNTFRFSDDDQAPPPPLGRRAQPRQLARGGDAHLREGEDRAVDARARARGGRRGRQARSGRAPDPGRAAAAREASTGARVAALDGSVRRVARHQARHARHAGRDGRDRCRATRPGPRGAARRADKHPRCGRRGRRSSRRRERGGRVGEPDRHLHGRERAGPASATRAPARSPDGWAPPAARPGQRRVASAAAVFLMFCRTFCPNSAPPLPPAIDAPPNDTASLIARAVPSAVIADAPASVLAECTRTYQQIACASPTSRNASTARAVPVRASNVLAAPHTANTMPTVAAPDLMDPPIKLGTICGKASAAPRATAANSQTKFPSTLRTTSSFIGSTLAGPHGKRRAATCDARIQDVARGFATRVSTPDVRVSRTIAS